MSAFSIRRLKPICLGLGDMGNVFAATRGGTFDNSLTNLELYIPGTFGFKVINEAWRNIQPNGPTDFITTNIDAAIASVVAYNLANPLFPLSVRLRIWTSCGGPITNVPTWALAQNLNDGVHTGPLSIQGTPSGLYWYSGYNNAVFNLLKLLGAKYDMNIVVQSVSVLGPATITDEPFNEASDPTTIAAIQAAGYTDAQMIIALQTAIGNMFTAFPSTSIEYTFNPFKRLDSGSVIVDNSVTTNMIAQVRSNLAQQGIPANHALQPQASLDPSLQVVYAALASAAPSISFQMVADTTQWAAAIPYGASLNPNAIELWNGNHANSFTVFNQSTLSGWSQLVPRPVPLWHWAWATTISTPVANG